MPSVVIAGGTSPSLGRHIVQGVLSLAPHWKPVVLTRTTSSIPSWLQPLLESGKVELRRTDYTHPSLVEALQGSHTVISVLVTPDETWYSTQIAVLNAAKEAGAKRFAPSEFGVGIKGSLQIDLLAGNMNVWQACEESGLEWTRFENGLFMNYLGFGVTDEEKREAALGGRDKEGEWTFFVTEKRAELPVKADGTFPRVSTTAMEDIGKFVAKALDLEKWENVTEMVGETLRFDEVVAICEKYTGGKWKVEKVTPGNYNKMIAECKEDEYFKKLWLQLGLMYTRDAEAEGVLEPKMNGLFEDVKPLTVEAYMKKYYS